MNFKLQIDKLFTKDKQTFHKGDFFDLTSDSYNPNRISAQPKRDMPEDEPEEEEEYEDEEDEEEEEEANEAKK